MNVYKEVLDKLTQWVVGRQINVQDLSDKEKEDLKSQVKEVREKQKSLALKKFKKYVQDRCPVDSFIRLKSYDRGKFGRILGEIYEIDSELSINEKMIEDGYAVPYTGGNKEEIDALHEANRLKLIEKGVLT